MKDMRTGMLLVVPAAVALMSIIWFLRKKSGKKDQGRKDSGKATKSLTSRDNCKPEAKLPSHPTYRDKQGITLTQRKIPEMSANESSLSRPLSSHPPKSSSDSNSQEDSSLVSTSQTDSSFSKGEDCLTSDQKVAVQNIVQTAIGDSILEASHCMAESASNAVATGDRQAQQNNNALDEPIVEPMIAAASASTFQAQPPPPSSSSSPPPHCSSPLKSDDISKNDNCSAIPPHHSSSVHSPSKIDRLEMEINEETIACEKESDLSMGVSPVATLTTQDLSSYQSAPPCSHSDSASINIIPTLEDKCQNRSPREALPSSSEECMTASALTNFESSPSKDTESQSGDSNSHATSSEQPSSSNSQDAPESDSSSSVRVESSVVTDASDVASLSDCSHSESKLETSEKSTSVAALQASGSGSGSGVNQHSEEPTANSTSPVCDSNSVGSSDSGRGGSEQDPATQANENWVHFEFNMPSDLCGRLIGRQGKNINFIKSKSGANVSLTNNPFTPEYQICQVVGTQNEVDEALTLIRRKFPLQSNPGLSMAPLNLPIPSQVDTQSQPIIMPEGVQMGLPEGVSLDVFVSAIVNAGHIFVQQPTHRSFSSLDGLTYSLNTLYGQDPTIPSVPEPVECGVICVCENDGTWYRTMITSPVEENGECQVKFVDYGGYAQLPVSSLKQIRTDFMTLPFQAVECFLANVSPVSGENYFSEMATLSLSERTQLKLLKCQVVARSEDGTPFIHLYDVDPNTNTAIMVNRTLVDDNLVRWVEIV